MAKKKKSKKGKYDYKKIGKQTKAQAKASSTRKGGAGSNIFKSDIKFTKFQPAADEDHTIDIVPFQAGDSMPIDMETDEPMAAEGDWVYTYEYWRHAGIGPLENETVICPERTFKQPCPICEHRRELIAEKAFDEKKMGNLYAKRRNLYNIICYDTEKSEELGVQLFDVSHFYFEKHISKLASKPIRRRKGSKLKEADPFKNFADPSKDGVTIEWSIEGAKSKNDFDTWMGHQLITRDYNLDEAYLDDADVLDQIVEVLEYAELYKKYWDEDFEDENEEEKPKRRKRSRDEEEDEEEEDEEEIEDGEEEDDEEEDEPDEDIFEDMSRKELKAYNKETDLGVTVKKKWDDDELREKIREAVNNEENDPDDDEEEEEEKPKVKKKKKGKGKKKKKKKVKTCPHGGTYGADFEEMDECDECKVWSPCQAVFQEEYLEEDDD